MTSNDKKPNIDQEQLARENVRSASERLPERGAPGLGSSDGEVPPDAIRGPIGEGVEADDGQSSDLDDTP